MSSQIELLYEIDEHDKDKSLSIIEMEKKVFCLREELQKREDILQEYESEIEIMMTTVQELLSANIKINDLGMICTSEEQPNQELVNIKGLAFHGIELDKMEKSSVSDEMRRNFLEHLIIRLLRREYGIQFSGPFLNICRYVKGSKLNGVHPIAAIFENISDKHSVWTKIKENSKNSNVVVTQFNEKKILETKIEQEKVDKRGRRLTKNKVKEDIKSKSVSPKKSNKILDISTSVPVEPLESCSSDKTGSSPRKSKMFQRKDSMMVKKEKTESDADVYGELDASKTLLFHGLESDIIEEQMSEDKEFRKEVLEQKVNSVLNSLNFTRKIRYQVTGNRDRIKQEIQNIFKRNSTHFLQVFITMG